MSTSKTISREKIEWLHNVATSLVGKESQIGMIPEEVLRLTTALLTGMGSDPVGVVRYVDIAVAGRKGIHVSLYQPLQEGTEVFAAPPAPVAVPECFVRFHQVIKDRHHGRMPEEVKKAFDECHTLLKDKPATPVAVSDPLITELLVIAKNAADEADECGRVEHNDDSDQHTKAIADWERRAAMLKEDKFVSTELQNDADLSTRPVTEASLTYRQYLTARIAPNFVDAFFEHDAWSDYDELAGSLMNAVDAILAAEKETRG